MSTSGTRAGARRCMAAMRKSVTAALLTTGSAGPVGNGTIVGGLPVATAGCDMDWNTFWVGSRTQWNVTKDFYMGVDVLYQKLSSASTVGNLTTGAITPSRSVSVPRCMWMIRTTGRSASACIATSIPDRVIMGV